MYLLIGKHFGKPLRSSGLGVQGSVCGYTHPERGRCHLEWAEERGRAGGVSARGSLKGNDMGLGARCKAWVNGVLGSDPHMRIRMSMAAVASFLMLACAALLNFLALAGLARPDGVRWWTLVTVTVLVAVLVLIRSGWSLRLPDPALTQFQIRYALASNAVGYVILGEARGITPVILSLILMFGIFGMSIRQMTINMLFALLSFGAAIAVVFWLGLAGNPWVEMAYAVMVFLVLVGSTFIAIRMQHIRRRLTEQKNALTVALEQIGHLATHDELTGLINRRRMTELMEAERQRCERGRRPLALALLDLDHFKLVNDRHGHAAGDEVLRAFVACVQGVLRSTDVLARWGGEEFILMLYDTDARGAAHLLERVRTSVEAMEVTVGARTLSVTVSAGLALGEPGEAVERTLERADQALYRAKEKGRNQVVYDGEAHEETARTVVGHWHYI